MFPFYPAVARTESELRPLSKSLKPLMTLYPSALMLVTSGLRAAKLVLSPVAEVLMVVMLVAILLRT